MALELIQNAEDAKTVSVVFEVTDRGLVAVNSDPFTYCGEPLQHLRLKSEVLE